MRRIPLTQGLFAIVDDKDFDFLNQWNWWVCRKANTCYAVRKERLENGKWRGIR